MRYGPALAVALLCAGAALADDRPHMTVTSRAHVSAVPVGFGGLSGLAVDAAGRTAEVLNDRGVVFHVQLDRFGNGRLHWATVISARFLFRALPRVRTDTEGLARYPDGTLAISIENLPAVLFLDPDDPTRGRRLPIDDLGIRNDNRRFEALALSPDGALHTLPEQVPPGAAGFPILRLRGETWETRGILPPDGAFRPVGADFDPEGRLYVLERAASLLGFRSRVRRLVWSEEGDNPSVETLFESALGEFDNLEALSIWQDEVGRTRLLSVSDNNFLPIQKTEFVEFLLHEPLASAPSSD